MTPEDRKKIISNEYTSLIIESNSTNFPSDSFRNILNEKYAILYRPVSEFTLKSENSYSIIPKLFGLMDSESLAAMGVNRVQNVTTLSLYGEGVLLGFVDTGIDYNNPVFKTSDGKTRIVSIWDQTIENMNASENIFYYGTEYNRDQINNAILSQTPYSVVPSKDDIGHGTMLAGTAGGGKDEASGFQGVAPQAEFVVVKLKQAKKNLRDFFGVPDSAVCFQQDDLMLGIKYLTNVAAQLKRPIAICIGVGSSQGNHDGNSTFADYISWVGSFNGRAFMVSAGNEGDSKNHYFGTIDPKIGSELVELQIGEADKSFSMEIWGYAPFTYSIDITSPSGQNVSRILPKLGESRVINFIFENTTVYVDYFVIEPQTGSPLILVRFLNAAPGMWKFNVFASGSTVINYHIWLPLTGFISEGTYFPRYSADTTITAPGNLDTAITVTAYDAATGSIYTNASRGLTKNGYMKPDLAAPGVNVLVPQPGNKFIRASGTSIAAANATGIAAMILEWGIVRERYASLNSMQVERFLIRGAETKPNLTYPNNVWGYGTINIYNTFISLRSNLQQ